MGTVTFQRLNNTEETSGWTGAGVKGQEQTYLRAGRWTDRWPTTASSDLPPTEEQPAPHHTAGQAAGKQAQSVSSGHMLRRHSNKTANNLHPRTQTCSLCRCRNH